MSVPREVGFCSHVILDDTPPVLVLPDVREDDRFLDNPYATQSQAICFYAGAAILCAGVKVGTISVMDYVPRPSGLSADQAEILKGLADVVGAIIEQRRKRVLEHRDELARLMVGVSHHLKSPIARMITVSHALEASISSGSDSQGEDINSQLQELMDECDSLSRHIEITLQAVMAYDASRTLKSDLEPEVKAYHRSGAQILAELQIHVGMDRIISEEMNWSSCENMHNSDIQVHLETLAVVLSTTMTLGTGKIESVTVGCSLDVSGSLSVQGSGRHSFLSSLSTELSELSSHHERIGRFQLTVTMKEVCDLLQESFELDSETIHQCNTILCSTILSAEGGGYEQQRMVCGGFLVTTTEFWLPCTYCNSVLVSLDSSSFPSTPVTGTPKALRVPRLRIPSNSPSPSPPASSRTNSFSQRTQGTPPSGRSANVPLVFNMYHI